ncbi:hypothetical protein [Roseibium sp.]|uniref:hypothetical protein n=1 Tax=Roseibium sp. TaxID=1936156 RepID=UPI003A96B444
MMKYAAILTLSTLVTGGAALADNKSKWGEGTAYDPRGIHQARAETRDDASAEPFKGGGLAGRLLDAITGRKSRPDTIDAGGRGGSSDSETRTADAGGSTSEGSSAGSGGGQGSEGGRGNGGGHGNGGGKGQGRR